MMWLLKNIIILIFSVICVMCLQPMVKNANNFGAYTLAFEHYGNCKGPKSKNLTAISSELNYHSLIAVINITFQVDAKIDEVKIQFFSIKDNKKNFLWNYKLTDPCKHYAIAAVIKHQVNADNCLVKKGNYISETNFVEIASSFMGGSFFYGTYSFRADVTSKKGNIACFNSIVKFKKDH